MAQSRASTGLNAKTEAGRICGFFNRFRKNRSGAVILLFGLTLIPMLGFIGGAIDYANAYRTRAKLQNALDAAALTAGRHIDTGHSEAEAQAAADKVLEANLGDTFPAYEASFSVDTAAKSVIATATMNVDTYILGVLGHNFFPIAVSNTIKLPNGKVEVALVLDNSGSMSGSKLTALKDAANSLTNILYASTSLPDYVKIGIAPFAATVNVGTGYSNASWMDTTGQSSIHFENFDNNVTRWTLYNQLNFTSWGGCVEVRPAPHDTDDTTAGSGGDSYFVPTFAPDEPDGGWPYTNSYLDDDDGSCSGGGGGETEVQAQEKTCKYNNETPSGSGPNYRCTSRAITPLTATQSTVTSAINNMIASGQTNIMEGVMWGWRILSPEAPFTEGRSYADNDNRKVMILMTDGANTITGSSSQNMSRYSAFGFSKNGRLRSPTSSSSQLRAAMNDKTSEACTNAKGQDILIYTIAFNISDPDTLALLNSCATSASRAFDIDDGDALIAVFEAIAGEINKLRITS